MDRRSRENGGMRKRKCYIMNRRSRIGVAERIRRMENGEVT